MPARPFGERRVHDDGFVCIGVHARPRYRVGAAQRSRHASHVDVAVTAFAMGPPTQRTLFPLFAAAGIDSLSRFWELFMTAAWFSLALNIAVVEWWIRRTANEKKAQAVDPRGIAVAVRTA
jgi:hypothetical protein